MDFTQYLNYNVTDFLEEDYFVDWCISPNKESDAYWAEFLRQYPEKKSILNQADKIIGIYRQQQVFTNEDKQQAIWQRLENSLNSNSRTKIFRLPVFLRVAAVITIFLTAGTSYWFYINRVTTITTSFGQVKTISLPDQSTVILNGNSAISYTNNWNTKSRQVWIKGEGLFKIKHLNRDTNHIKANERFIVHCADMNVEVLGTEFNVKNRHNKTDVGLLSGKIRLSYTNVKKGTGSSVILKPGDFVEYYPKKMFAMRRLLNPAKITSWTSHQFVFSNVQLNDIVSQLQDEYGYQVKLSDPEIGKMKIDGEINVASVNELLETITTTLHVNIYQNNNAITIYSVTP